MYVEMQTNCATANGPLVKGTVYELEFDQAASLVSAGFARTTTTRPPEIQRLYDRLDDGEDKRVVFMPFVGEFGHLIMSHVRIVHFNRAAVKIVCCRPGQEVLFPSASGFITDWTHPVPDCFRVGTGRGFHRSGIDFPDIKALYEGHHFIKSGDLTPKQEIHPLFPLEKIPFAPRRRGLWVDVAIGTRCRAIFAERNWTHFQHLADALTRAGFTFATVGARPIVQDLAGQAFNTADFDTDASIETVQNARLYIGTDSGASHLAAAAGANMLLFRETRSGSRDLTGLMGKVNPGRVEVIAGGWTNPELVINAALKRLCERNS